MEETNPELAKLQTKLDHLSKKQSAFWVELRMLQDEVQSLKAAEKKIRESQEIPIIVSVPIAGLEPIEGPIILETSATARPVQNQTHSSAPFVHPPKKRLKLEKFIGENLINKIGIIILILGVAIGVKYSIEHNLISETARIIMSYVLGIALCLLALKLKKNYHSYSAVLLSGGLAILYFTSYFAYSSFGLFSQTITFVLMLALTVLGVLSSLKYNSQVIALIGLVGAYAVPFLLGDGSGNAPFFLSYVALVNLGILIITQKKLWKALGIASFGLSWVIFITWYINGYAVETHFNLALIFVLLFFAINYLMLLSFKLIQKEDFKGQDILPILLNALLFFLMGYALLNERSNTDGFLGIFALGNALLHFLLSQIIQRKFQADQNLVYLIIGIALSFFSISAIIELDGPWLSSVLVIQAITLFWIGRTKSIGFYEKIAYPFLLIALFSLTNDWITNFYELKMYEGPSRFTAVFNISFLHSLLFSSALGFGVYIQQKKEFKSPFSAHSNWGALMQFLLPAGFVFILYNSFRLEIAKYWLDLYSNVVVHQELLDSEYSESFKNPAYNYFSAVWQLNFSLIYLALLGWIAVKKFDLNYRSISFNLIAIALLLFNIKGLLVLSELRELYLADPIDTHFEAHSFYLILRYISFLFVALALWMLSYIRKTSKIQLALIKLYPPFFHIVVLWILSAELIHILELSGNEQSYKLGLSILWGIYSMALIIVGIWKKKQIVRIMAISLFAITLVKLFVYDISHLNTIAKTIVFVSLGILLLITSFLYNKYKHLIADDMLDENETNDAKTNSLD